MRSALHFVALFCLLCSGPVVGVEWGADATGGINYNDNVSNAIDPADRKSDGFATLAVAGGAHRQLGDNTNIALDAVVDSATYFRYSGIDNLGVGARAQLHHKFGLGSDVPWAALSLSAVHRDFRYDDRDGWQYDAGVAAGRRIRERWEVSASAHYDRYEADRLQPAVLPGVSSAAYDVAGWTFGAHTAVLLTQSDTVSLSASWRHGTVTAVTPADREILEYSSAVALDPVFSGNPIAYRISTDTDTLSVNWSHALGRHSSFNLGYAYLRSKGDEELGAYTTNVINLSILYSR